MRHLIILQFFIFLCILSVGQVSWPVSPFNQQHAVVGSIGECRESNLHYHMGVDITNGTDFNVYSIQTGVVTKIKYTGNCWTSYIDVTDDNGVRIRYFHIKKVSNSIFEGCSVIQGDQIGEMFSLGGCNLHVHIEKLDGNFLTSELYPFTDESLPTIGDLTFCLNGATFYVNRPVLTEIVNINNVNYLILYNKIDIIVDAHDTRLNETGGANGGFLAPFSIEYEIYNINNQSVNNGPTQNYNFSNPPPNRYVQYAFRNGSTLTNFQYILTNDPAPGLNEPADKYFNTILQKNVIENWPNNSELDAHYNGNAHYSDGLYEIVIRANDVDYGNNPRHSVTSSKQILIDNFRPYISNVKIKEYGSSEYKYSRGWHWIVNQLLFEPEPPNIKFDINKNVNVEVTTSEPMKKVRLQVGSYSAEVNCGTDLNKTTWFFSINKTLLSSGLHTLRFTGEDLAGNPLQSNPAVIPIR